MEKYESKNQQRNSQLHRSHVLRTVHAAVLFSVAALGVAVLLYFLLKPYVGTETVSWMCILGAAPFAALGFITYHGVTAEQFLWAWPRSEPLELKELKFESENTYYEALKGVIENHEKEALKHDVIH